MQGSAWSQEERGRSRREGWQGEQQCTVRSGQPCCIDVHGLIKVFVWPMCCVLIFPFFTQEVDRYLRHHDFLNLRKKEILYKKWLEDVSEPLLWKIEDKMDSQSREEIQKRREEQLSLYLNYCKKKVSRCKFLP